LVRPSVGPGNVFQRIVERLTTPRLEPLSSDPNPIPRIHISRLILGRLASRWHARPHDQPIAGPVTHYGAR
jgi:hypothetical protein